MPHTLNFIARGICMPKNVCDRP